MFNRYWRDVLRRVKEEYDSARAHSSDDVIVEIGSGYFPKVGLALANFSGTYILVEPNEDAIKNVVCIHAKVMPRARVLGLRMTGMALAMTSFDDLRNITNTRMTAGSTPHSQAHKTQHNTHL